MIEKMCSRGAIVMALGMYDEMGNSNYQALGWSEFNEAQKIATFAEEAMLEQVRDAGDNYVQSIPVWNDSIATGVDDVREQMLLAAKNLRNSIEVG